MRYTRLTAPGVAILVLLAACTGRIDPTPSVGAQQPSQVVVTNSTAQPVPTTAQGMTTIAGNVGISGTPNVNVANTPTTNALQAGSWNVGINGLVQVGNPATNPVQVQDVGRTARQPFQIARLLFIIAGSTGGVFPVPLPAGRLVVIEQISARATLVTGQLITMSITSEFGGPGHSVFVVPKPHPFAAGIFETTRNVRIYAHANSRFEVAVSLNNAMGGGAEIHLHGYSVDCVSPPACTLP